MTDPLPHPVRVIALGSPHGGDDELALELGARLERRYGPRVHVRLAGRPGPGLVDLLTGSTPVVLLDVVRSAAEPGTVHRIELGQLSSRSLAREQVSSHGFGPGEALELARVLGRALPPGTFVGLEGEHFELGASPSPRMRAACQSFERCACQAIEQLESPCTSPV